MEVVFQYFDFSSFFKDESDVFNGNQVCYSILNKHHFLIFEQTIENQYNLYVAKFDNEKSIGFNKPELIELVVENYDKSKPAHRIALKSYYN